MGLCSAVSEAEAQRWSVILSQSGSVMGPNSWVLNSESGFFPLSLFFSFIHFTAVPHWMYLKNVYLFVLAAPGLSCACGSVPYWGSDLGSLRPRAAVSATGPGKSLPETLSYFIVQFRIQNQMVMLVAVATRTKKLPPCLSASFIILLWLHGPSGLIKSGRSHFMK